MPRHAQQSVVEHTAPARTAKMISNVKTVRADRTDALLGWFLREIGERTGATATAAPPVLPLRSPALFSHHEIALFARDLHALHVGDTHTGTVIALRKSAGDRWVCRLDAADGRGITARLPPFNPSRENVARVSAGGAGDCCGTFLRRARRRSRTYRSGRVLTGRRHGVPRPRLALRVRADSRKPRARPACDRGGPGYTLPHGHRKSLVAPISSPWPTGVTTYCVLFFIERPLSRGCVNGCTA